MAEVVKLRGGKEFHFKETKGPQSKYPWDEWLSGGLLKLKQSDGEKDENGVVIKIVHQKDFEVHPDSMPGKLKSAARRRFKVVKISKVDQDDKPLENSLIIQAREMTPVEVEFERNRRAGRKAKREAKRAKKKSDAAALAGTAPATE